MASGAYSNSDSPLAELMHSTRWIRAVGGWQILGGAAAAMTWLDLYRRIPDHQFTSDGPYFDLTLLWWYRIWVIAGFQSRLTLRWNVQPTAQAGVAIDLLACFCFWTLLWYEQPKVHDPATSAAADPLPPSA